MSSLPARGLPVSGRLLGILRSWLNSGADEMWQPPAAHSSVTTEPNPHFESPVRVLVVDDNPVNLMVVSALLESRGLVPFLAADGAEAVALAGELPFDLILMDLQMPILDGLGATLAIRRLEAEHARSAAPVLAYSSSSPSPGVLTKHGFSGSLAKPCEDQELDDCLARWCPTYRPASAQREADRDPSHRPPASRNAQPASAPPR